MSIKDLQSRLNVERQHLEAVVVDLTAMIGQDEPAPTRRPILTKLEQFKIIREYRTFEQHLLNHRITWILTTEGILLATYGYCWQKLLELPNTQGVSQADLLIRQSAVIHLEWLLFTIGCLGLAMALLGGCAIWAGKIALWKLRDYWKQVCSQNKDDDWTLDPAGAGSELAVWLGFFSTLIMPILFVLAWLFIIFYMARHPLPIKVF